MSALLQDYAPDGTLLSTYSLCEPKLPYGHGQRCGRTFYHRAGTLRLNWRNGRRQTMGCSAEWACGARSSRPTLLVDPPRDMPPCPQCFRVVPTGVPA